MGNSFAHMAAYVAISTIGNLSCSLASVHGPWQQLVVCGRNRLMLNLPLAVCWELAALLLCIQYV